MAHRSSLSVAKRFIPALIVLLLGCGNNTSAPARAEVQGTVFLDSKLLESGMIRFIPIGGQQGPAAGAAIQDGVYLLPKAEGPVVGTNRVEIVATNYLGFAIDDEEAMHAYLQKHGGKLPPNPIHPAYNVSSSLTAEIEDGVENQLDFDLASRPAAK